MHLWLRILLSGIVTWLIPFLVAIPFYQPDGTMLTDPALFKSIMVVTGGLTGSLLLIHLFRQETGQYLRLGIITGSAWIVINWLLDSAILIPMSGDDIPAYLADIGLRYLLLPIMTIMAGIIAADAAERNRNRPLD